MRLFLDTNLFIAVLGQEADHAPVARDVLNSDHDLYTSVLNLMEVRSVLSKKERFGRERLDRAEQRISSKTTVTVLDAGDVLDANERQSATLLYPMDALILTAAESADATLVSFDSELQEHGALPPGEVV
jgi:predicted nucleic acid-binding protein